MTMFQAIILGITQGLTELLPISSSAHLYLIPWIFNWDIPDSFDVALHFGTLLAIGIFFFKDWINLIKGGWNQVRGKKSNDGKMFWYIVIATIPGGIIGFILDHFLEGVFKQPIIIAIALIVMGILLYIVDKKSKSDISYYNINFKQSMLVGISQAIAAAIPGVSRSGITMTVARKLGIDRESAAKYSFMLGAPITAAAVIFDLKHFSFNLPFFIGVISSFIVGVLVIKFLMDYLKKGSFKVFAIYRVIIGIIVIGLFISRL